MIAGILVFDNIKPERVVILISFGLVSALLITMESINKERLNVQVTRVSIVLYLISVMLFGGLLYSLEKGKAQTLTVQTLMISDWETFRFSGEVLSVSTNAKGKPRADVLIGKTEFNNQTSSDEKYRIRLISDQVMRSGSEIEFTGTLIPVTEMRNPGQFDYKEYLKSKMIFVQVRMDSLITEKEIKGVLHWSWWREEAQKQVDKNFDKETAPIAKALLLGNKQDLEGDSKQAFARAGLSHILAVSGLHVGFIVAPFWLLIPLFWMKKYGKHIGLFILIVVLWFYAGLTGFSASVLRASVMAIFLTWGKLFRKSPDSLNLTAAAAIALLVIRPSQLFEIGFQLSFSAVCIILLILPVIQRTLPYWMRIRWYAKPLMVVIVSIVVQLGLYPLQVFYFGEVSVISPVANALFVPLLGLIVPFSLICILISSVITAAGIFLNTPSVFFLKAMTLFVEWSADLGWTWMEMDSPPLLLFPLWIGMILFIASWRVPEVKWKLLNLALVLICIIQIQSIFEQTIRKDLKVTFFDVGQGDAALIQTPNGKNLLIDTGIWNPGYNSGTSVLLPFFEDQGIEKLDAVILSHPHADHIGGIISLIDGIKIDTIYNSGFEYDSGLYQRYLEKASEKAIPVKELSLGDQISTDPSVLLLVLGPDGMVHNKDPNQHSVILELVYGETEILFTGDAGEEQERRLTEEYSIMLNTDILKVGHHGSRTSSGADFLKLVKPEIAVVSLAEQNRFSHPHTEAIHRIMHTNAHVFYTSRDKAIVFKSDGAIFQKLNW